MILLSSHLTNYHHEGIRKQTKKCRLNILINDCHFKLMSQGFFPLDESLVLYEIGFLFVHVLFRQCLMDPMLASLQE